MTITRMEVYIVLTIILAVWIIGEVRSQSKAEQLSADMKAQREETQQWMNSALATLQHDKDTVKTPAQIAVTVPKYTPDVKPVLIVPGGVPTQTQVVDGQIAQVSLPDAPSAIPVGSLVIMRDDVPAYWNSVTACAEGKIRLEGCQKDYKTVMAERDAWQKASRGSIWTKFWNCGTSVGTNAASGSIYGGSKGAIAGVGFGALGCVLQKK